MGHGMDLIVEVLLPCLLTLPICTFMIRNLTMMKPMKITLKNHGLLICVSLWDQMIPPGPNVEKNKDHNQPSNSSTSMEKMFARMGDIMQEIINEVKEGGVQLIYHTTSLLCVIAIDVWGIHLSKVNEVMHPNMVFHCVNDGLGNSVHWIKDWHEMMLEGGNICKKRARE